MAKPISASMSGREGSTKKPTIKNGKGDKDRTSDKKRYGSNHDGIRWRSMDEMDKANVDCVNRMLGAITKDGGLKDRLRGGGE